MDVMSEPFGLPQLVENDIARPVARSLTHALLQDKLRPGVKNYEAAGKGRRRRLFDGLASESRVVTGLIGRLYDDPMKLARSHVQLREAIEAGQPDRILSEVDHHIGVARREGGLLVTNLSPATQEVP